MDKIGHPLGWLPCKSMAGLPAEYIRPHSLNLLNSHALCLCGQKERGHTKTVAMTVQRMAVEQMHLYCTEVINEAFFKKGKGTK